MIKKIIVIISVFLMLIMGSSIIASAEVVDWPINKVIDKRHGYTDEEVELVYYMKYCYQSYELELDTVIHFSTRATDLCKYPVPGKDGVFISVEIPDFISPETIPENPVFHGHSLSMYYDEFIYPYNIIDKKLVEAFGTEGFLLYQLEDEYKNNTANFDVFYKTKIDIGKKTINIYLDKEITPEQAKILLQDDTLDSIYVYIIIIASILIVVTGISILIAIYKRKEKRRKEEERERRRLEKRRRHKKHRKHKKHKRK